MVAKDVPRDGAGLAAGTAGHHRGQIAAYNRRAAVLSAGSFVEACCGLGLDNHKLRRIRWERIDESMDKLRAHYGYMIIQRAIVRLDPELARINPSEHTIHPVGYFYN